MTCTIIKNGNYKMQPKNVFPELSTFDWEELHGKQLRISVQKTDEATIVVGYDGLDNKIYYLHMDVKVEG